MWARPTNIAIVKLGLAGMSPKMMMYVHRVWADQHLNCKNGTGLDVHQKYDVHMWHQHSICKAQTGQDLPPKYNDASIVQANQYSNYKAMYDQPGTPKRIMSMQVSNAAVVRLGPARVAQKSKMNAKRYRPTSWGFSKIYRECKGGAGQPILWIYTWDQPGFVNNI